MVCFAASEKAAAAAESKASSTSTSTTAPTYQGTSTTESSSSKAVPIPTADVDGTCTVPEAVPSADVKALSAEVSTSRPAEATSNEEPKEPWLSQEDMRKLQRKVEWYFSDTFLSTDQALHHKTSQHLPEGWICCSELMALEPIRKLGAVPELIIKCLRKSHLETKVTLTADEIRRSVGRPGEFGNRGIFVRRRQPLPPLLSRERLEADSEGEAMDPGKYVLADRHQTLNRLRDLWRVNRELDLSEVGDDTTVFREKILPEVSHEYRPPFNKPVVLAVGYERIIYGDHGPYIEFASHHLRWKAWPHFFDKRRYNSYFNEYYTRASHSIWEAKWRMWDPQASRGVLMLYDQSRTVSDRPWAPGAGSDPHAGRPTGYADYRPGYYYLSADALKIIVERQSHVEAAPEVTKQD